jgi:peptidoglycan/LPS O-acetylase OafA/YrhL
VHLREILTAFTIDVVMMAGIALPTLIIAPRLKQSSRSWIGSTLIGGISGAIMVALAIWYLGTQGSSGYGGFHTSSFWWGMGGFGLIGGFMALLMGTFGTDAGRTNSEARKSFLVVSIATLCLVLALGTPFAYLVTWPRFPWMRLLIAPVALVLLVSAVSPLAGAASWITARLGGPAKEKRP